MAQENFRSRTARLALNNGTDSQGETKTVNVSIGTLSKTASDWSADKFLAIVALLEPCLTKSVESAETVVTNAVIPN